MISGARRQPAWRGRACPPHVVERILNHVPGTFKGVAGVYNRFGYLPEMREALLAWEAHIKKLTLQDTSLPAERNQAVTRA